MQQDNPYAELSTPDMTQGPSLFNFGEPKSEFMPRPDELKRATHKVLSNPRVEVKEYVTRTYDLGDEEQSKQYAYDMEMIFFGLKTKAVAIVARPPLQFVSEGGKPRYIAHLEWVEFRHIEDESPLSESEA
jgi:hypothetical protein